MSGISLDEVTKVYPNGFREAFWVWLKVGCFGFGGPAGQIALLHREVVERRAWIDEERFAHALSFCMLLPGPEAQQLATWLGWRGCMACVAAQRRDCSSCCRGLR